MPEILSRFAPDASVVIANAGDRPLARHPELAVLALEAVASWANVESFQLGLFVQMLGGDESVAASIYLSLDGDGPKSAAIRAAAESAIKDQDTKNVLLSILELAASNAKERHALAHGVWGDSPNIPDAVLLADPRKLRNGFDKSSIYVYRAADFARMIQSNDELCGHCHSLTFVLRGHVANRDGSLLRQLLQAPRIAERIAFRLAKTARANQAKPAQSDQQGTPPPPQN